jgi:hypothetical protein
MAALRESIDRTSSRRGETTQLVKRKGPKRVEKRPVAAKAAPAKSKKASRIS